MKLPSNLMQLLQSKRPAKMIRTLFLSKRMLPVSIDEPLAVVLSPAYYWFREVVLPAKSVLQAKKLAPSYFDTIIPEGEYEYMAIARNDAFWLFAYDQKAIAEALADAGIKASQVRAVYFAQTECIETDTPLRINENAVLAVNDGVVSVVNSRYVEAINDIESYCGTHARSRHKVNISLYRSGVLDKKQIGQMTLVAVVLLAVYLANYIQLRAQYRQQLLKAYALQEHYKLPETSFQLKSLMHSLEGRRERQLKLRTVFRQLTLLPLQKGEAVAALTLDVKKGSLKISLTDPKRAETLKAALEKFVHVTSAKVKDNIMYASIAYE